MNQQHIMQFQMLEQEAEKLSKQLQMIENNLSEIVEIRESLEEISKKETNQILANLGKKIFLPVEIKDKNLVIEIGNKKFVKKSIPETINLIEKQVEKMQQAQEDINGRLEELQESAREIMEEIEKSGKENHNHKPGEKCSCEEDCESEKD